MACGAFLLGLALGLMFWAALEDRVWLLWVWFPLQVVGLLMIRFGEANIQRSTQQTPGASSFNREVQHDR